MSKPDLQARCLGLTARAPNIFVGPVGLPRGASHPRRPWERCGGLGDGTVRGVYDHAEISSVALAQQVLGAANTVGLHAPAHAGGGAGTAGLLPSTSTAATTAAVSAAATSAAAP